MPWAVEVYLATITINDDNDYGDGPDLAPREEFDEDNSYTLDNWIGLNDTKPSFGERQSNRNKMYMK